MGAYKVFMYAALAWSAAWLVSSTAAHAQSATQPGAPLEPQAAPASAPGPAPATTTTEPPQLTPLAPRGFWDVVKFLPILFYTPETSAGFGAGILLQFDLPGATAARRPSSVTLGGVYTLEQQIMGQFVPELRFGHDDYVLKLDVAGARYPSRFYGIGNHTDGDVFDTFTDRYLRSELDWRMRLFDHAHALRPLFLGVHVGPLWSSMREPHAGNAGDASVFAGIDDGGEREVFAMGVGPSLAWDSRDSLSWPQRGAFLEMKSTFYEPWLGSRVRYRRIALDLRHYQLLWFAHILAMRVVAQAVWGEVPFQRLPQLGGASLFRGWQSGQLRERMLIALEAEYRAPVTRRLALVAFGSVGRVASSVRAFDFRHLRGAVGGGLRLSVDKRDRVNIRLDLAYGDRFYPYLQFREAF